MPFNSNSAGRALGRIISKFSYFRNVGFKTFNRLFESNVESIMSYSISTLGLKDYSFEKIQSRAIRYFLGVHPKTPIPALYGEVGWIQFKYKRWISMCRSWNRFIKMDDERLNKQVFLQDFSSDISSWCTDFHNVCINLDLTDKFENLDLIDLDLFIFRLKSLAAERWKQSVLSKPKLRTYKLFKQELKTEDYVNCLMTRFQRSTFAKFRCGILPIQIEVGRFRGQRECDRKCPICKTAVESEIHFMFECPRYHNVRNEFLTNIGVDPQTDSVDKLRYCMDLHQKSTAKYIVKIWRERQNLIIV